MSENGLAVASDETTTAPTMYREEEQDETVARGCVRVTEVIAYDATKEPRRYPPGKLGGKGDIMKDMNGDILYVEVGRRPYFYQDSEAFLVFKENNPKARLETFGIQMLKSIAIKRLNDPDNMKQFERKV